MLTVLGGLAGFERALIIARTGDGRVRAKAHQPPTAGGYSATRGRRYAGRSRADLWRKPGDDIEVTAAPFRAGKRGRRIG
jgi:hypothetical protein